MVIYYVFIKHILSNKLKLKYKDLKMIFNKHLWFHIEQVFLYKYLY
jgi:hypothetical protein